MRSSGLRLSTDWSSPNQIQRRASNTNQAPAYNSAAQRPSYGKPAVSPAYNSAAQRPLDGKPVVSTACGLKTSSPSRDDKAKPPSASLGKQDFTCETLDDDSDEDKPDVESSMQFKPSAGSQTAAKCSAPASKPTPINTYTGNKNANMADQSGSKAEPSEESSEESSDDEDGKKEQSHNNPKAGKRQRKVASSGESSDEEDDDIADDESDDEDGKEEQSCKAPAASSDSVNGSPDDESDEESSDDEKIEQGRAMPSAGKTTQRGQGE
ncbi:hypothetical protein DSO57_1025947 [Entomophthora muscae]|uniref:Uncharacterized protein n=1 Tax=Entomophthora muscae TaxID=34485 RepID=A0ACC2T2C4_9FUNG|nr:hypothetical protein DSO57_1025947 [Entomophthora muscae]